MKRIATLGLMILLLACGQSAPTPSASTSAQAVTEGPFQLTFELPKATWTSAESITGRATLALLEGVSATLSGSGRVFNFEFMEVGGARRTEAVWTADCGLHPLTAGKPLSSDIVKSGTWQGDAPSGDFNREFMTDPLVRLPVGTWDITAIAQFSESTDCSAPSHYLKATVRVTITG